MNKDISIEKEIKEFNKWRQEKKKLLPDIANRVFKLRNKHYNGCGFHYAMESELGYCISMLNDFNNSYRDIANQLMAQVKFEGLISDLEKIESELKRNKR